MKTIRYFAALLLILNGVLHSLSFFKTPQDPHALIMLAFAIVYFIIGILLILNLKFSAIPGIIFPITGMGVGVFVIGPENVNTELAIMFAIDAIVVICCTVLFFKKK